MVRLILLTLWLSACTVVSKDTPHLGEQVEAPNGWAETYCPQHKNELGCK